MAMCINQATTITTQDQGQFKGKMSDSFVSAVKFLYPVMVFLQTWLYLCGAVTKQ
jgi:hypothetical protein